FTTTKSGNDTTDDFLTGVHDLILSPGQYELSIASVDTNDRSRIDSQTASFKIYNFSQPYIMLSSVELGNSMRYVSGQEHSTFIKNGIEVVPNVLGYYDDKNLKLTYYAEVYNIQKSVPGESFRIETMIMDQDANVLYDHTSVKPKSANSIVFAETLPIESLTSGKYRLVLRAFTSADRGEKGDSTFSYKDFYVNNSALPPLADPYNATDVGSSDFAGRSESSLDTLFQEFSYIATSKEKDEYKKLNGADSKAEYLFQFWKTRNEGQGQYTLKSYYTALDNVNNQFKTMFKPGWKTDRGRVYLQYGAPSYIDNSHLFSTDSKPYYIWQYYDIEGGVEFVFVDVAGFGDFKLVHSTERTEIHDPDWLNHYANNLLQGQQQGQ
ncbi:MAG TPA: GWxTD domain-containing protein, partial [Candidatus Kapabacteria bacterium]|nr:GWxTD domain-containing protein [Candidatus Kapabacteria bacterium]